MSNKRTIQEREYLRCFGEQLRTLRVEHGLTQEELAAEAGFSRSYYTEIETGKRNLSILNIRKLARCLHVSSAKLLDINMGDK